MEDNRTNQEIKADNGKPRLTLVPTEILTAIPRVREYGLMKYGGNESWKLVSPERYRDALFRHLAAYINDPYGIDDESKLPHLYHIACNVAFLCELDKNGIKAEKAVKELKEIEDQIDRVEICRRATERSELFDMRDLTNESVADIINKTN